MTSPLKFRTWILYFTEFSAPGLKLNPMTFSAIEPSPSACRTNRRDSKGGAISESSSGFLNRKSTKNPEGRPLANQIAVLPTKSLTGLIFAIETCGGLELKVHGITVMGDVSTSVRWFSTETVGDFDRTPFASKS